MRKIIYKRKTKGAARKKLRKTSSIKTIGAGRKKSPKCKPNKHYWSYRGGECPCLKCGWYLQPGGKITKRP
jgi:hypothetical protein